MIRLLDQLVVAVAPLPSEAVKDEVDAPSGLLADFVEDAQYLVLLSPVGETFARGRQRTQSYACNTPACQLVSVQSEVKRWHSLTCP